MARLTDQEMVTLKIFFILTDPPKKETCYATPWQVGEGGGGAQGSPGICQQAE